MKVIAGVAQLVELLPSKQNVASSSLVSRSILAHCPLRLHSEYEVFSGCSQRVRRRQRFVQRLSPQTSVDCPCGSVVEHSLGKGEVARSIRAMGTNANRTAGRRGARSFKVVDGAFFGVH
jgi:hypothetical protein